MIKGNMMKTEISEAQMNFLEKAGKGNYHRTVNDRTGLALKKMGLVTYAVMFGWNLTGQGQKALSELKKGTIECWSCKRKVSLDARSEADGFCPYCDAEIELEE